MVSGIKYNIRWKENILFVEVIEEKAQTNSKETKLEESRDTKLHYNMILL